MKKSKFLLTVIVSAALGAALVATNPTLDQFEDWMQERSKEKLDENAEEGLFGGALNDIFGDIMGAVGKANTTRDDYYVVSLYTVDLGEDTYRYLGICTTFMPLQTNDPISDIRGDED